MRILVTGGAGYIGSHTIIELINQGYNEVISVDNYLNSKPDTYNRIEEITGKKIEYYDVDLSSKSASRELFNTVSFDVIIHFAALKSVPESVEHPIHCYQNNLNCLLNVLEGMEKHSIDRFIFSSSCSIYGNPDKLPVTEDTPFGEAESPYARSKQMGERMIEDLCKIRPEFQALSLRYFNPVGAHPSGLIGEAHSDRPNNLLPVITQTAAKLREKLIIFGKDYPSEDGTCIRDYIHVTDIADAHVKGIHYMDQRQGDNNNYKAINLGSGNGTSVLEMVNTFEKITGVKVNYSFGERRDGDVYAIYANNEYAKNELSWEAKRSIEEMLSSAWKWQEHLLATSSDN